MPNCTRASSRRYNPITITEGKGKQYVQNVYSQNYKSLLGLYDTL